MLILLISACELQDVELRSPSGEDTELPAVDALAWDTDVPPVDTATPPSCTVALLEGLPEHLTLTESVDVSIYGCGTVTSAICVDQSIASFTLSAADLDPLYPITLAFDPLAEGSTTCTFGVRYANTSTSVAVYVATL